jgi:hypothetical protein
MTKDEILDKALIEFAKAKGVSSIYPDKFPAAYSDAAKTGMDEWAKVILNYLLTKSDLKEIVMVDGELYWESDKEGDQPIQPEDILKMYEKEVSQKTDNQ